MTFLCRALPAGSVLAEVVGEEAFGHWASPVLEGHQSRQLMP